MGRVTIKDIASSARVSAMTVSNVINGKHGKVSKATITRIQRAIDELGYTPNFSARSLKSNQSRLIGVVVPFTEHQNKLLLDNPFYAEMVSGIEQALRANGYHMMLAGIDEDNLNLDPLAHWNVDALIVLGIYRERLYESVRALDLPTLLIDSYVQDPHFLHLRLDDVEAARQATAYLTEQGHERIAFVTGQIRAGGVIERRFAGYKAALEASGLSVKDDLVFAGSVSFDWGKDASGSLAADSSITAVFCTADLIAAGVLAGLHGHGKHIPDDVSVMGFDNLSISRMVYPALTTVDQNILEKGSRAGTLICELLGGKKPDRENTIFSTIVERDSVARRPG